MTTAVQHRRGTTAEHSTFTGLEGEVTIDTTKDTAVIHDGVLAGGYPLAKETLANVNPSALTAITGAATASDDLFMVYDASTTSMKKITRAELNNAIEADALANVSITGGTIDGTTIGGTTPAAGSFTTLSASSSVTLSGGTANGVPYLNGSKVLTSGSALTFDGSEVFKNSGGTIQYNDVRGSAAAGTRMSANGTLGTDSFDLFQNSSAGYVYNRANTPIIFGVNATEQMRLTSTGLGIGTSSPAKKLHIDVPLSGFTTTQALLQNSSAGSVELRLVPSAYANDIGSTARWSAIQAINGGVGNPTSLAFLTNGVSADPTEQMRLTSTGLGIGTSSPYSKLTVSSGASNDTRLLLQSNASGGSVNAGLMLGLIGSSGYIYNYANGPIIFGTNSADKATLDSSGNLGLGVTPSAWGAMLGFELGSYGSAIATWKTNRNTYILSNAYFDSVGFKYKTTGSAVYYNASGEDGAHKWLTAPSGTAGNAISFSQVMTLDANGNLGIGTSSPGAKLHVSADNLADGILVTGNDNANVKLRLVNSGTGGESYSIQVGQTGASNANLVIRSNTTSSDILQLNAAGNLGLGVTPSAWGSGTKAVQVGYTSGLVNPDYGYTLITENSYNNGTSDLYLTTRAASTFRLYNGGFQWYTAPSGTAGNAISFTQAMTLTAGGDLLVGATGSNWATSGRGLIEVQGSSTALVGLNTGNTKRGYFAASASITEIASETNPLLFTVNGSERARIDSSGRLGIGYSSPTAQLVVGGTGAGGWYVGSRNALQLRNSNSSGNQSNYIGFGSAGTPSHCSILNDINADGTTVNQLNIYAGSGGGVYLANGGTSWSSASDERLKDIIEPITNAVTKVGSLRSVIGKYKTDNQDKRRAFLIAQDVLAVLPEAVTVGTDKDKTLGLAYTDLIPLLVSAIQEQQAIIEDLKSRLTAAGL